MAMATQKKRMNNAILDDVRIAFRNFSGKEGQFNRAGDRNFAVMLDHDVAAAMAADGWNVKELKAREEDELPQPYISVKVNFNGPRPPKIMMVTSRGKTPLGEDEVSLLDWADILKVDLIVSPYNWTMNGNTGVTAYLQTIFVFIREDELELRYADVPDSAASSMQIEAEKPDLAIENHETIEGTWN